MRHLGGVAVVAAAALVAGCGGGGSHSAAPSSPSSSASTVSPEQAARSAATKALTAYYQVTNAALTDPTVPVAKLATVATGSALTYWRESVTDLREDQYRVTGSASFRLLSVGPTGTTQVTLRVCDDESAVDTLDRTGTSVTPKGGPTRTTYQFVVQRQGDATWRVATQKRVKSSC